MLVTLSLRKWLWRAQLKSAVIPFLFVELGFLIIYFFGAEMVFHHNADAISKVSQEYMKNLTQRETRSLGASLEGIESHTNTLAKMTLLALQSPTPVPEKKETERYQYGSDGSFYTDKPGGSAAFYSGIVPIGEKEKEKVWKTTQLDGVMKAIKTSQPLIQQLYFNSFDSYNRIYPYFDVKSQYPSKMNIPSYNFYYEADLQHNPQKTAQWTNAYFDPAGSGWMVSSIAPVWRGNFLEGVVGIDITLFSLLKGLSDIHLPWEGYAMLLDTNGSVLAIPNDRRKEWGLSNHVDQNSASNSHNWKALAPSLNTTDFGVWDPNPAKDTQNGQLIVWNKVPNTNWFLLTVLDKGSVFAKANALHNKLNQVGWAMSIFLLIFYLIFFYILYKRSKKISQEASAPIVQTQHMVEAISMGNYPTQGPASNIFEIQQLSDHIIQMGKQVELANRLEKQNRQMTEELYLKEKELAQKQQAYIEHLAHEIRTPLMQISCITTHLNRALDEANPDTVRNRLQQITLASKRVSTLFNQQYVIPDADQIHTKIGDILDRQPLINPQQISIWVDENSKNIPLPITEDVLSSTFKSFVFLLKIDHEKTPVFIQAWNNEEGAGICLQDQPFESFQAKSFLAQLNQDPPSENIQDDLKLLQEVIRQTGGQIRLYHLAAKGKGLLVMWPAVAQHKAHILSY